VIIARISWTMPYFGLRASLANTVFVAKPVLIREMRPWLSVDMHNQGMSPPGRSGWGGRGADDSLNRLRRR
jgi:hypothetical protein